MLDFRGKRFRVAAQIVITLLSLYLLLVLAVALMQRRLIYFPSRFSADTAVTLARQAGLVPWQDSEARVIGWRLPARSADAASVLILHGNAGSALHRTYFAKPIHSAGDVEVFVLEYPGYGARSGSPGMRSFLEAAEEAFQLLPTNRPIYLVAESIGSGVAAHLARKFPAQVSGVLFFAPYDDLAVVGQKQMPWLPVKLLLRDRFKPAEWLESYRGPVAIVLAEHDEIMPPGAGQRLHDSYRGPKKLETIQDAGHNDIGEQSIEWWRNVFAFWQAKANR